MNKDNFSQVKPIYKKRLFRSEHNRVIGGVAGGLGEYFSVDPMFFRLLFILFSFFGGSGIIVYCILWIFLPTESAVNVNLNSVVASNIKEIKKTAFSVKESLNHSSEKKYDSRRIVLGAFFLFFGILFLFENLGLIEIVQFSKLWPLLFILIGLLLIF